MRVLVTGGAGLIGLAARRILAAQGHEVTAVDITDFGRNDSRLILMPLSDYAGLERIITERGIEAIVHGGGISGPVMARDNPLLVIDVNITATAHLLDMARRHQLRRFILLSSHVVYGDVGPGTITEEFPLHPGTSYAASKIAGEALVESYSREFGFSAASLRLTRVYGPYRRDNCFLRSMILDAAAGKTTVIPCDPGYLFHYIHVDDVAEAIAASLSAPTLARRSYNITSGQVLTMPEVIGIARGALPEARVEMVLGVDDAPDIQIDFDLARAAADLGWRPRFALQRGFSAYLAAMPETPDIAL
ncbi:MAG: NAD-dependent epimerase/dehydratase [Hyphomicrobiales bacterium]|nr:NAD-dependent epimerase/dehydratase [Hyphomicrobiales bacterium]